MLATHDSKLSGLPNVVTDSILPGEWIIGRERERIDISIRNARVGVLIFIENKIAAPEQPDQLMRYRLLLDRQLSYQIRLLVYLQPQNRGLPQSGKPHIYLTYEKDITSWLSLLAICPEHVRANIRQYVEVIQNL